MPPHTTSATGRLRGRRAGRPVAAAALAVAAAACGGAHQVPLPDAGGGDCRVAGAPSPGSAPGRDTLRVAAPGPLEGSRPPRPSSPAERIAYAHLYAGLVDVDCVGRMRPALASSWEAAADGRRWTFRLRDAPAAPAEARGPSRRGEEPARAVTAAWRRTGVLAGPRREPGAGAGSEGSGVEAAAAAGGGLAVTLRRPAPTPALLAEPRYAVTGPVTASGLPAATGSHRPAAALRGGGEGWLLAPRREGVRSLRVVAHGGTGPNAADPRDLLDRGVDLLVARRPAVRRYAGSLPGYRVEPLPWDRTYVLALPGGAGGGRTATPAAGDAGRGDRRVRRDLARDAVPADARASRPPHWWRARCPSPTAEARAAPEPPAAGRPGTDDPRDDTRRLVYPAGDATAAALASRLAALDVGAGVPSGPVVAALRAVRPPGGGRLRAVGLAGTRWADALRRGDEAGYVLRLPRRSLAPCRARDDLAARAPWAGSPRLRLVPLVDTRPHVVVRRGVAGVRLGWDGTLRLETATAPPGAGGAP